MGIRIKNAILFMVVASAFFISLPEAKGGCAGGCTVSGGGASTGFIGDRATNIDMSSFDEFVRDNLGNDPRAKFQAKRLPEDTESGTNSSLNQTGDINSSQNSTTIMPLINNAAGNISENRTIAIFNDNRL